MNLHQIKNYTIILLLCFVLFSCNKIEPKQGIKTIDTPSTQTWETKELSSKNEDDFESCGITSCGFKDDLNEKYAQWKLNLPNLDIYTKRFTTLVMQYPEKEKLIESNDFQNFTQALNADFFWCKDDLYTCEWTQPYWEDETNFLFYIFIPTIVVEANLESKWWTPGQVEAVIQAIKRKDFDSEAQKDIKVSIYKNKIDNLISSIDISQIDTQRLLSDNAYFNEIILDGSTGLHDRIMSESYGINIDWEEDYQLDEIMMHTIDSFYILLEKLWVSKELFVEKIIEINGYSSKQDILKSIYDDLNTMVSSWEKNFTKVLNNKENNLFIPNNRYYRNDELYMFTQEWLYRDDNLNNYLVELRHKILLIFNLWSDQKLYELTNRLSQYKFEKKFLLTNIYKYSKYIKIENTLTP